MSQDPFRDPRLDTEPDLTAWSDTDASSPSGSETSSSTTPVDDDAAFDLGFDAPAPLGSAPPYEWDGDHPTPPAAYRNHIDVKDGGNLHFDMPSKHHAWVNSMADESDLPGDVTAGFVTRYITTGDEIHHLYTASLVGGRTEYMLLYIQPQDDDVAAYFFNDSRGNTLYLLQWLYTYPAGGPMAPAADAAPLPDRFHMNSRIDGPYRSIEAVEARTSHDAPRVKTFYQDDPA